MRARVAELRAIGYNHEELIDATKLRRLVPAVAQTCPGGIVSRRDGVVIPFRATQAFRRAAVGAGATVIEGEAETGLAPSGTDWRVETSLGGFTAPWRRIVASVPMAGRHNPSQYLPRQCEELLGLTRTWSGTLG